MLERCFKNPSTLHRFRCGPAGPFLDGFALVLLSEGYAAAMIADYVSAAVHFAEWAAQRGTVIADLDDDAVLRFVGHLPGCRCSAKKPGRRNRVPFRVRRFLRFLREAGVAAASAPGPTPWALLSEYGAWMHKHRGVTASTIAGSLPIVEALLDTVTGDPAELKAAGVRRFVLEYIRKHAPSSAGCVTTAVRCFLRYLVAQGRCSTGLIEAVPKVPTWRLARLPRYLPDADVERLIAATDRKSAVAQRDRAMLLLLARLGLRGSDVIGLRLADLNWAEGHLRVAGKGRRETRLPLPQDVGDAILGYLKKERPAAATDRVFLTARTIIRPLSSNGLRAVVGRVFERAGVQSPSRGTHTLRHSLATRLLREGMTLDAIGAVLRHRDVTTTAIYAKVDVNMLRQVAQPWPGAEVAPC